MCCIFNQKSATSYESFTLGLLAAAEKLEAMTYTYTYSMFDFPLRLVNVNMCF